MKKYITAFVTTLTMVGCSGTANANNTFCEDFSSVAYSVMEGRQLGKNTNTISKEVKKEYPNMVGYVDGIVAQSQTVKVQRGDEKKWSAVLVFAGQAYVGCMKSVKGGK